MELRKQYSIAFSPSLEVINYVKTMKDRLYVNTGKFGSRNAQAHITICELHATDKEIGIVKQQLIDACKYEADLNLHFDEIICANTGTVFILPNSNCKNAINDLIDRVRARLGLWSITKRQNAHISIGRNLTKDQIVIASQLFNNIDIRFLCNSVVIRILENSEYPQFRIQEEIFFGNKPLPQQSLF